MDIEPTVTTRQTVLEEALGIVTKDRNAAYGDPEDNFREIANLWGAYLGRGFQPYEVADMMILMKVARNMHKPSRDNYVDVAGYAACGAEVAHV